MTNTFDFQTPNIISNEFVYLNDFLDSVHETIANKITEFEKKDSGWTVQNIFCLDINEE